MYKTIILMFLLVLNSLYGKSDQYYIDIINKQLKSKKIIENVKQINLERYIKTKKKMLIILKNLIKFYMRFPEKFPKNIEESMMIHQKDNLLNIKKINKNIRDNIMYDLWGNTFQITLNYEKKHITVSCMGANGAISKVDDFEYKYSGKSKLNLKKGKDNAFDFEFISNIKCFYENLKADYISYEFIDTSEIPESVKLRITKSIIEKVGKACVEYLKTQDNSINLFNKYIENVTKLLNKNNFLDQIYYRDLWGREIYVICYKHKGEFKLCCIYSTGNSSNRKNYLRYSIEKDTKVFQRTKSGFNSTCLK